MHSDMLIIDCRDRFRPDGPDFGKKSKIYRKQNSGGFPQVPLRKRGFWGITVRKMAEAKKVCVTKNHFLHACSPREVEFCKFEKMRLPGQKNCGRAYLPAPAHMTPPTTQKFQSPQDFIMIKPAMTKKVGVRIFPETLAVNLPVSLC